MSEETKAVITTRRVGWSVASVAATTLAVVGIAEAQDATGIVGEAWRVGGPIAAVVVAMALAGGYAIRTLWNSLQAERTAHAQTLEKRTTDSVQLVREMRDCINTFGATAQANTVALNKVSERLESYGHRLEELARPDRRSRS